MTSLYGEYIKEREGQEILEISDGFAAYKIIGDVCYLTDIYIRPHLRKSKLASTLINTMVELAKQQGCTSLLASVCLNTKDPTASMQAGLAYGFKLKSYEQNLLWLTKDIKG